MDINLDRGLTRLYLVLWALWLLYLVLFLPRIALLSQALFNIGLLGIVTPGALLFALKWVGAGFRSER